MQGKLPTPVSPAGSVGSRQSATGARSPLSTRFWSGCGRAHQRAENGRCCPVPPDKSQKSGAGLVLGGNFPSQNGRKRAENPRKSRKHIDLNRHCPYNKKRRGNPAGVCCRQAVSHSLYSTQRGGDTYGKQPRGESPAIRSVLGHRFGAGHRICPKSVLTARLAPERST